MPRVSPLVDEYIAKAPEYARPILKKLRSVFHKACPELEENIKWRFPHFDYKGIFASMAAFKHYVTFGFWKAKLMSDPHKLFVEGDESAMSGCKFTTVADLPADKDLIAYIHEAMALNDQGIKVKLERKPRKPLPMPSDLKAALKKNKNAQAAFDHFSPSHRREYIEWITEAKQEATRTKRLATTIEWLTEGKARNWKYER